jgi:glutamate-5-semialdehyde dehydrogenase
MTLEEMGKSARNASFILSSAGTGLKNATLERISCDIIKNSDYILAQNQKDITVARQAGITEALIDRLMLTKARIDGMAEGILKVAALEDPTAKVDSGWVRPNGLRIFKARVPLGVIGIIYEARPNVTVDAAALCLKSGNVCILRGGKEAINSNLALVSIMRSSLQSIGLPQDCVQILEDTSRETARELMRLNKYLDVLIPRGGVSLIRSVVENSTVPVIETGIGNCHVYIDKAADLEMGANIIFNAKTSRPSVCNAAETLLVHEAIAAEFLPRAKKLLDTKNVELRGCAKTCAILGENIKLATQEDWVTEYNDYILAIKVVENIDEAIKHINTFGSRHSEAIVTESYTNSEKFLQQIDAAAVYVNASTRFTDGEEFGFGAEIGISTQKLHARGPMGLAELTTIKYLVYGSGQTR